MTPAALTGAVLHVAGGNTMRVRDLLAVVARQLDAIDDEGERQDRGHMPLAKAEGRR